MNAWIYPETIEAVGRACALYLEGKLNGVDLQAALYKAEQEIVAYEEKWLRSLLFDSENKIEEIIYTESPDRYFELISPIVINLVENL